MFYYVTSWSKLKDYYVVFYAFIPCYSQAEFAHLFCPVFDNPMNVLLDYQWYSG